MKLEARPWTPSNHCCSLMEIAVDDDRYPVVFSGYAREYTMALIPYDEAVQEFRLRSKYDGNPVQVLFCCPWCGTDLPSSLRDQWFSEIRAAGYDFQLFDDIRTLPQRYQSTQWWAGEPYETPHAGE